MKKILIIISLIIFQGALGQDLNGYKYVVVPVEYEFLKEPNQYRLADLTKFLFEKEGFEVYLEGNVPQNLKENSCQVLHSNLHEDSGLFVTRLSISLKDCNNREVFRSEEGKSREKEYEKGYQDALRKAFESIAVLDYKYNDSQEIVEVTAIPRQPETIKVEEQNSVTKPEEEEIRDEKAKEPRESSVENELIFSKDQGLYFLKKTPSGYNFYQKGMAEPFAALVKSSAGNSYIYSSVTSKGVANFNQGGDLVIELLDAGTGDLNTTIYKKQD